MPKHLSYHYVTHKESDTEGYRVAEGLFAGVVWLYRNVKLPMYNDEGLMIDPERAEEIPLTFEYEVLYNPTDEDLSTGEFDAVVGDILLNIIDESLENDRIQFNTKNRNSDTE
tara:strand:+ start:160 stop:498 length:339 start_codon:yes stop_codon:yes gene_type:complete